MRNLFFLLIVKPFLTFFIGLRVYGRKNLPQRHPFIIVANHSSHLDTVALLSIFPISELRNIRPVAASDYFERNKFVSLITHTFFNILSIERCHVDRKHNPLKILEDAIGNNQSLIFFPEGTRASSEEIGTFQTGIIHLVKDFPSAPIIPVYLSNMGRALPKGEFIFIPFICEVRIGEPLLLRGSKDEILSTLKEAILNLKDIQ